MNEQNLLVDAGAIISALLIVGGIMKHGFPKIPNRIIPVTTLVLGTIAYMAKTGTWTDMNAWVQSVMVSASAVGIHSGIKNTFSKNGDAPPTPPAVPMVILAALLACGASRCLLA